MTPEQAKTLLPIITAFSEGKTIQVRLHDGPWHDILSADVRFDSPAESYRIKPEPREFWLNIYGGIDSYGYPTREDADACAARNRKECIRVKEVLE